MRKVLTLAALLLLGFTSAASAECAWVLWGISNSAGNDWHPWNSYGDRVSCERVAQQNREELKSAFNVVCFPDTVDPRGPKPSK